jgi:hypothetical protein
MTINAIVTSRWAVGLSSAALLIIAAGLALGMTLSMAMILLALAGALGMVIAALGSSSPTPSVSQILQSLETKDDEL